MKRIAAVPMLSLLLLAGCATTNPSHPPVPAIPAEQVPNPPRSRITLIWEPGHFNWDGAGYLWVRGKWVSRSGHGTLWQDGFWQNSGGTSTWVTAHWM